MVATFLSVLWYLVWSIAALHIVMTLGIWSSTLRTLGLSCIRHCPRMLRLSFRASPIRELTVVILLPLIAIRLIGMRGVTAGYVAKLPVNAFILIGLLFFTLLLVPPTALVFSSSTDKQLRWALSLKKFTGGRRVISLLDTGYMVTKPKVSDVWSVMLRRSGSLTDVLRTSNTNRWQASIREFVDISPIIIVDTRVCTEALLFEASTMLTPEYAYKAIFVGEDDGTSPILEKLLAEGRLSSGFRVSIVKEAELGELLQRLVVSRNTLPMPGSEASNVSTIGEWAGRNVQSPGQSHDVSLQDKHVATILETPDNTRLSSSLTAVWRWTARFVVVNFLVSAVSVPWLVANLPQSISTNFSMALLWSLLAFNWVCGGLYFCLAHSLRTVCLKGDTILVSDNSKACEIRLSQVSRVAGPDWTTMRRITLHLHEPSVFGKRIVFAGRLWTAGKIARNLRHRLSICAEERAR